MKLFAISAMFVMLLLLGCAAQQGGQPAAPAAGVQQAPATAAEANKTPIELIIEAQQQRAVAVAKRPDYLPAIVFSKLPAFPTDFYEKRVLVQYGKLDFQDFGPEYWKQPEWYPNFEGPGVQMMQNPSLDRWGAWGYGVYPSDMLVVTDQGTEFTATTYIYTSWLVETYQGTGFQTAYPTDMPVPYEEMGFRVIQDPKEAKNYFEVSYEPTEVLLEPAFPIFEPGWTQKVLVHVKVKPDAKPGNYVIGVDPGPVPAALEKQWFNEHLTKYVTSAFASGFDRPFFQIAVAVKEKGAA